MVNSSFGILPVITYTMSAVTISAYKYLSIVTSVDLNTQNGNKTKILLHMEECYMLKTCKKQ